MSLNLYIPYSLVQPRDAQWHGAWGNARILDKNGNVLKYADDGFCSAYDYESVSCWVNGYGKDLRDPIKIGSKTYSRGIIFQGNSVWHVVLPSGNKHARFRAEVGRWAGQNDMQLSFKVVQRADHKLWLREMWGRTALAFPDKIEEMEPERNSGAWDTKWNSISDLASNYAQRTSTWNGYRNIALEKAKNARTEKDLNEVRGLYHASLIRNKIFFLLDGASDDWFPSIDEKIEETKKMRSVYGSQYTNYQRDLNLLNLIKENYNKVNSAPTLSTNGWDIVEAGNTVYDGVYNFTMQWPPWLYDDVEPPAKRIVTVSNAEEYQSALSNAREGDRIVVKPGIYNNVGHLYPVSFPKQLGETNIYPLVIVAEKPGYSHFVGDCTIETRGAKNIIMKGFAIRHCDSRFQFTRQSRQIRFTHNTLMGTKDSFNLNRNSASIRIDHTYMGAGTERVIRRLYTEDGGVYGFGRNQFDHMFLGQRRRSNQNGAELLRNIKPVNFFNNFVDKYVGEDAELAKCGPGCKLINNTISRDQKYGQFPGRCYDGGVIEGNYFLSGNRIRTGGYDKKVVHNNYIDGSYILIGTSSYPEPFFNSVNFSQNTIYDGTLGINSRTTDPRHQFRTYMKDNLFLHTDTNMKATDQNTWTGGNNIASPNLGGGLPSSLWRTDSKIVSNGICVDEFGIVRLINNNGVGFQRKDPPFTSFDTRVGPSYLPVSVRINRHLVSEYNFDKKLFDSTSSSSRVHSDWGAFNWGLFMYSAGGSSKSNLYGGAGSGVSGQSDDFALDTKIGTMGGNGGVVKGGNGQSQNLNGFTISGWFNANKGSSISNNAILVSSRSRSDDSKFAYEIKAGSGSGRLALTVQSKGKYYTWETPAVYTERNEWVFFAVTLDTDSSYVAFYKGTKSQSVHRVHRTSISNVSEIPTKDNSMFTIGGSSTGTRTFAGLIDNIRLWYSENGPDRVDDKKDKHAELTQEELEYLRRSDINEFKPSDPTK